MTWSDPFVPEHDTDVYGDVQCPKCDSYDIQIVSQAIYRSHVGIHATSDKNYDYVAVNSADSAEVDNSTEKFYCTDCKNDWPIDGPVYWEWYE